MMPEPSAANLATWALHVAALTAIGAGLPAVFGLASPRARMAYYRLLLVAAVALPILMPASPAAPPPGLDATALDAATRTRPGPAPRPSPFTTGPPVRTAASRFLPLHADAVLAAVLAAGLLARTAWVLAGIGTLWRLRRSSLPLDPRPDPVEQAVALAAADAEFRVSPEVPRPVSFGARRPAILLPVGLAAFPPDEQRAVACHELIHVRRHDWLRTIGDEAVRALLWFHPAVWWLLDQIHLAREQMVDREVVEITGSRRPYLEALVKLARHTMPTPLRPAALFLRRAHLPQRVSLMLKEGSMSKRRLVAAFVSSLSLALVAGALVVQAFPLQAAQEPAGPVAAVAGQQAPRPGVPVDQSAPKIVSKVDPVYPPGAKAEGIQGVVIVVATVDGAGTVTEVKVIRSVNPLLDQAAVDAVRQWRYEPTGSVVVLTTTIRFALDDEKKKTAPGAARTVPGPAAGAAPGKAVAGAVGGGVQGGVVGGVAGGGVSGGVVGGVGSGPASRTAVRDLKRPTSAYPPAVDAPVTEALVLVSVAVAADGHVIDARGVAGSPGLWGPVIDAVRQWEFGSADKDGEFLMGFNLAAGTQAQATSAGPLRVGGNIRQPAKIRDVRPVYPADARDAGVMGVVIIEAVIGPNGKVTDGRVLRSIPGLDAAALGAVLQWEFTPTLLNGEAVSVIMTVTVNFTLG